jgi:ubiquitin-protein ligase
MAANRRLLKELAAHQADPNPALQMLEPESEEDMLTWVAILKGPTESAYHGKF